MIGRTRVLHVCSYYSNPMYSLLFEELSETGFEQDVFYFAVKGSNNQREDSSVVFSDCYSNADRVMFKHKEGKVLREMNQRIVVEKYDLIHAHSLFSNGYLALKAKREWGVPYIVAVRNTDVNSFFKVRPWLRSVGIEIMKEASRVVFISPAYMNHVLDAYVPDGLKRAIRGKSIVVPNGINELFLSNQPTSPRTFDGIIRIVQAGDVNRNKNQIATARACELLRDGGLDARLLVVGEKKSRRISRFLSKLPYVNVENKMPQKQLLNAYRSSDVFAMPSIHETFGLVYAEAMSQGLPVVYTKGQGFDGYYDEGEVGYSVNERDIADIANRILACYELREEAFDICIERAREFNWKEIANCYSKLYQQPCCPNAGARV